MTESLGGDEGSPSWHFRSSARTFFASASSKSICVRANCADRASAFGCKSSHFKFSRCCSSTRESVVTRDELRQQLWPSSVYVDFDHGLNNAIARLREALGDAAATPHFIETLPRLGYRFIYPLGEPIEDTSASRLTEPVVPQSSIATDAVPKTESPSTSSRVAPSRGVLAAGILAAVVLLALSLGLWLTRQPWLNRWQRYL